MARGRPRPVALEIPMDVLAREAWVAPPRRGAAPVASPRPTRTPSSAAAELLDGAERPMIFVGGGAQARAPRCCALAERLRAPVVAGGWARASIDDRRP